MTSPLTATSNDYIDQAAEVARNLKHGSYDAVRALAAISVAASLARIADALERNDAS